MYSKIPQIETVKLKIPLLKTFDIFYLKAKARMKMLNAVTSRTHLPHGKFDNQQTHYDSVRYQ